MIRCDCLEPLVFGHACLGQRLPRVAPYLTPRLSTPEELAALGWTFVPVSNDAPTPVLVPAGGTAA